MHEIEDRHNTLDASASSQPNSYSDWIEALTQKIPTLKESETSFVTPSEPAAAICREAQNALRVARTTALEAISSAHIINRVEKTASGKTLTGRFTHSAQSSLRSALLFAGAGLDRTLKQLLEDTIRYLIEFEATSRDAFHKFAESHISSGPSGIDARSLVNILLGEGKSPKDIVLNHWSQHLQSSSAQSVERVEELASALGVTKREIREKIKPGRTASNLLKEAFVARNEIAHELDIVKPQADARTKLENIQRTRSIATIEKYVKVIIDTGQLILNDVSTRLCAANYEDIFKVTYGDLMRK